MFERLNTEEEILRRITANDESFIELIYPEYYNPLCNYAFLFVKSRELAEDIVHETIIKIWENRSALQINGSFRSYLFRSVHNNCINSLKETEAFRKTVKKVADQIQRRNAILTENLDPAFLKNLFASETESRFNAALRNLPEQCREIFMLSRFEYLSYAEIAEKLNISVNTVKTQMKRALAKLRETF